MKTINFYGKEFRKLTWRAIMIAVLFVCISQGETKAQCQGGTFNYGTIGVIPNGTNCVTSVFALGYFNITGVTAGNTYTFTSTNPNDYVTLWLQNPNFTAVGATPPINRIGEVIGFGQVPYTISAPETDTIYAVWRSNSGCSTDFTNRNICVTNVVTGVAAPLIDYCGTPPPPLTSNAGTNLNGFNFYFQGNLANVGNVGVGYPCGTVLNAKVDVNNTNAAGPFAAGRFVSNFVSGPAKAGVQCAAMGGSLVGNVGVNAVANGSIVNKGGTMSGSGVAGSTNYGVDVRGFSGTTNYGVNTNANTAVAGSTNYGVNSIANGPAGSINYGVKSAVTTGVASTNYGVHSTVSGTGSNYAVYAQAPSTSNATLEFTNPAGLFNGDVFVYGDFAVLSDERLKTNIKSLQNAGDILAKLNPKTYNFKTDEFPYLSLANDKQYGLIAQDVEKIMPELISKIHHPEQYDTTGKEISPALDLKAVNYGQLIPVLIQSANEQRALIQSRDERIEKLESQLAELSARLDKCCAPADDQPQGNNQDRLGNPVKENSLDQNTPNPFNENTTIRYYLTEAKPNSSIKIKSVTGIEMASFPIIEKGNGQILISGNSLSSGEYIYELIVNGAQVASRRMVLTK